MSDSWVIGVDWFTISDGDLAELETGVHTLGAELDVPFGGLVPPRYNWRIDRIELDRPPLVRVDRTRPSDSRGAAAYALHCSLLSGPHA